MPFTLNGIGTWYYGRKNVHREYGTCEFCQRTGNLASYDTTLYFVVIFLPLIPLGKKRVLLECPSCQKHRVTSLQDWEQQKQKSVLEAGEKFKQNPQDPEAAKDLIRTVVAFHDQEMLTSASPGLQARFAQNSSILSFLGSAYNFLNSPAEAEPCLRQALVIENKAETREELAQTLILLNRPAEALPLIQHILTEKKAGASHLVISLVSNYQALGAHQPALQLLEAFEKAFPELAGDRQFHKLKNASLKRLHSSKGYGAQNSPPRLSSPSSLPSFAKWIWAVLLCLGAGFYLWLCYDLGKHQEFYVVNGLNQSYQVRINGIPLSLPPQAPRHLKIPEGKVSVQVTSTNISIAPYTTIIQSSFLSRPFSRRVHVLNPDQCALLYWEETEYAERPDESKTFPYQYYLGEPLYSMARMDYLFEPFPASIELKGSHAVRKRRLDVMKNTRNNPQILETIIREFDVAVLKAYLQRQLTLDPEQDILLGTYVSLGSTEEAKALLKPHLDAKPVMVEVHRTYQTLAESTLPEADLIADYRQRLQQDPSDPVLQYLLGRVLDGEESQRYFLMATKQQPPCAYAYGALAWNAINQARFTDALEMARKALKLMPAKQQFTALEYESLLALGNYQELLDRNTDLLIKNEWSINPVIEQIFLLTQSGSSAAALTVTQSYCQKIKPYVKPAEFIRLQNYLKAMYAYATANMTEFCIYAKQVNDLAFEAKLEAGDVAGAEQEIIQAGTTNAYAYLELFIVASLNSNQSAQADAPLAQAVSLLRNSGKEEKRLASWLESGQTTSESIQRLNLLPTEKRIALAALGLRIPALRAEAFSLGKQLNYSPYPPALLLKKAFGQPISIPVAWKPIGKEKPELLQNMFRLQLNGSRNPNSH